MKMTKRDSIAVLDDHGGRAKSQQTLLNLNEKYLQNYFLDFAKCAAAIATNVTASKNIVQTKFMKGYCQLFGCVKYRMRAIITCS